MGNKKRGPRKSGVRGPQSESTNDPQGIPQDQSPDDRNPNKQPRKKRIEPLEPRILMSGTWVDPADPETPTLTVEAASGDEDTQIPLTITAASVDDDGSETVTVSIENVPVGATLRDDDSNVWISSGGATTADLTGWDLSTLTIQPPAHDASDFDLTVIAMSTEADNGDTETTTETLSVEVLPIVDDPSLISPLTNDSPSEDVAFEVPFTATLTDSDGSESLRIQLQGLPVGATVFDDDAGSLTVTSEGEDLWLDGFDLETVKISLPEHSDEGFTYTIVARATETETGDYREATHSVAVDPVAVADGSTVNLPVDTALTEDQTHAIPLSVTLEDSDGSEVVTEFKISGLPIGTVLEAGAGETFTSTSGNTEADILGWDLTQLQITPPADSDQGFTVLVHGRHEDGGGESTGFFSENLTFSITAVADDPVITAQDASGDEDTAISVDLDVVLGDSDGSETLLIEIEGVPVGAVLDAAGGQTFTATEGNTTVDVSAWDLTQLRITPPDDSDADFELTVRSVSTELIGGDTAVQTDTIDVTVSGVADSVTLSANNVAGDDGDAIPVDISAGLTDLDGSETLHIELGSLEELTVSDGVNTETLFAEGTLDVTGWDLENLTVTPLAGLETTFDIDVNAWSEEQTGGDTSAVESTTFQVTVNPAAVAPNLSVDPASGVEDTEIPLTISASLNDLDSETLALELRNLPVGAVVQGGAGETFTATGGSTTADITGWDLGSLRVTPPSNSGDDFLIEVAAISTESANSDTAETTENLLVSVAAMADAPTITVSSDNEGDEDTAIPFTITAALNDTDGSESLTVLALNLPVGSVLRSGADSFTATAGNTSADITTWDFENLTITPPEHVGDDFTILIEGTALEAANTSMAQWTEPVTIEVTPVVDAPDLSTTDGSGDEDTAISFGVTTALVDADGSETLTVTLSGVPVGATVRSGDDSFTASSGNTSVDITAWDHTGLEVVPPEHDSDNFELTLTSVSAEYEDLTIELPPAQSATLTATVIVRDGDSVRETSTSFELGSLGFHPLPDPQPYPEPNAEVYDGGRPEDRETATEFDRPAPIEDDALDGLGALRDSKIAPTEIGFEASTLVESEAASYDDPATQRKPGAEAESDAEQADESAEGEVTPEVQVQEGVVEQGDQTGTRDGSARIDDAEEAETGESAEEGNDGPFARWMRALRSLFGNEGTERRER